jgi:hypothetical protein
MWVGMAYRWVSGVKSEKLKCNKKNSFICNILKSMAIRSGKKSLVRQPTMTEKLIRIKKKDLTH